MASKAQASKVVDEKTEISQITEYLYLSGCTGLTTARLQQLGITCAVNCIRGIRHSFPPSIEYLYIAVEDDEETDLRPYFERVSQLIDKHRLAGGKTIVYCGLGISRSAALVIAYFMKKHQKTLLEAYKLVQTKRNIICPNVGFFRQLLEIEHQLYGRRTVTIIEPAPGIQVPDVVWEEVYQEVVEKMKNVGK